MKWRKRGVSGSKMANDKKDNSKNSRNKSHGYMGQTVSRQSLDNIIVQLRLQYLILFLFLPRFWYLNYLLLII